jgi:hypothetical protein
LDLNRRNEMGKENTPRSDERGMSPERDNRPLSDVAPEDSAALRGHGAHGRKSHNAEERVDPTATEPDGTNESARGLGSSGWGSEASGGSTIDKRGPKNKES